MGQPEIKVNGRFRRTLLPNGVRIVTEHIPSVRSISMGLWIEAGSRDETIDSAGICHFIEHMVFKGTTKRRMHQIAQRMESVGGYLNAFTSKEYTCFYARALDTHLERALDTLSDLVLSPVFPQKELEKEKEVVVEEMKMYEDSPEDLVFDLFEKNLYGDHPMGRPVIGLEESVRAFDREQLQDFMRGYYAPERTVITVAGNVDHERLVRLVQDTYRHVESQFRIQERLPMNGYRPDQLVERKPLGQAHLVLGRRCFGVQSDKRVTLSVLNTMLGGGMSSVLNQNIREKYGYCYTIYSFVNLYSDTGEFGIYMGTDQSKVDRSKKLILRELNNVAQSKISPRKMQGIRNQMKGSVMLGLESMDSRMMRLGRQEVYYKRYFSLDEVLEQIDLVTEEDLLAMAQSLFDPDQFSSVELLPDNQES